MSFAFPALTYPDAVGGVAACPELKDALLSGWRTESLATHGPAEEIGRYRKPGGRETYRYKLSRCVDSDSRGWWHAYGAYCPFGRLATDADSIFLDGGGFFEKRPAALRAIHL